MSTLYVTEPGSRIEKEYRHLLVTCDDETLLRVPLASVDHVVLVGQGVGATTPALHALLAAGIGLSLVSGRGELLGRLEPPSGKNLELRRRQYERAADPGFCLEFARPVVLGKLHNYRALALRWTSRGEAFRQERAAEDGLSSNGTPSAGTPSAAAGSPGNASPLRALADALDRAERAPDLATLRGIEGTASKAYFAVLRGCLRAGMPFDRRSRRPPADPVNALLSLGYTLLGEAIGTALEIVGLDPYQGFYHAAKYGRPALALDLLEEFRGPVADSVALTLINKRMLGAEDFVSGSGEDAVAGGEADGRAPGVYLKRDALKIYLREFSERLESSFTHPLAGRPLTYRKCLEVQARQAAKTITGELSRYTPLRVR
jgi:CRISP-associated protein Cas1